LRGAPVLTHHTTAPNSERLHYVYHQQLDAVLGKDFEKLTGPDNYNEWSKIFAECAFFQDYTGFYNGTEDAPEKPTLPTYVTKEKRETHSNADKDIIFQAYIRADAASQLAIYKAQLQIWKDFDKNLRSAIVLLRADVQPWVWKKIDEVNTLDPHLAYVAIQEAHKAPNDVLIDRALAKPDKLKFYNPSDIWLHLARFDELYNDINEADGILSRAQLINKLNNSLPHAYCPFINHYNFTYYNASVTEKVTT
jgi:hypothetical protein